MSAVSLGWHSVHGVRTDLTTGGLVAVIGALILGILGMHSLTVGTAADTGAVAPLSNEAVAGPSSGGSMTHMAMLCAAM